MTDLRSDYSDWLRVLSTVVPSPFIGSGAGVVPGFPYSLTSGAVQGPFNVAPWGSSQFFFQPATVDQRLVLDWYADAAATQHTGTFNWNMAAGIPLAQVVRNMGAYMTATVISAGGGTIGGSLWLGGSTRVTPGNAYQTSSFIVDWGNRSLGAGVSFETTMQYGYMGPAFLHAEGSSNKWQVAIRAHDILGNLRNVYRITTAAPDVDADVFLPALICTVYIKNQATSSGTFYAVLQQAQLP